MWARLLHSHGFWMSVLKSYLINLAFGLSINISTNIGKPSIRLLDGLDKDMASAFMYSAFFCGLLTPLFSSCFIRRAVLARKVPSIDEASVQASCWRHFLRRGLCLRSVILAIGDTALFGGAVIMLLSGSGTATMPVWAFLVLLVFFCVPVQVVTSVLNTAAVLHLAHSELNDGFPTAQLAEA
eukprot:TRINITY_DN11123_c0_g1_i1.p1 TRINITY_DN11123_c0_g1~~TRINITY_DN11123_c0_g1_i1.p1  ORF type:complete len:183 (-),score=29.00 TRINITY_DN11123_c0_g1_i1:58-606(-)